MPICNVKFYVGGREYKTLCNTVKNADSVRIKCTVDEHSVTAEISDKCYFKTIDGIELNGVKTDYYICKDYLNMEEFIYKLKGIFDTFINTALHEGKIKGTVDELLWTATQFPHVVSDFNKNEKMVYEDFLETAETESETKETSTETKQEMTTEIESAEETAKKTENSINMMSYGIPKTKFLPTEIFDTEEECDYWFKFHKFDFSLNRVFIIKDIFAKRTSEGIKKFRRYTAEITLKNIALESGLIHLMNEIKNHGFEVIESDFFGCISFIDCYVSSGDRSILFIENNESGLYIQYQYCYES